ncbi:hypothetical protein M885DRAFT_280185 [Pelagophyceae sp. CCMP2097]|nr:hypothetical protein M885DRAFT_280185 [Pelagophyceae sp. CCMP2097]
MPGIDSAITSMLGARRLLLAGVMWRRCASLGWVSPTHRYAVEAQAAVSAVRSASRLAKVLQATLCGSGGVAKADASPVTLADVAAQAVVLLCLAKAFPNDGFIAEESATRLLQTHAGRCAVAAAADASGMPFDDLVAAVDLGKRAVSHGQRVWTLDPIDGTKGFLRGEQFCCALALLDYADGEATDGAKRTPVVAVLGCPNLGIDCAVDYDPSNAGVATAAVKGLGAWRSSLLDADSNWAPMAVSSAQPWRRVEGVASGHSDFARSAGLAAALGITEPPVKLDSQAKAALLAAGSAQLYLRLPPRGYVEYVWDHAAQALLIEEAGGVFSDERGATIDFDLGEHLDAVTGIVASSSREVHDQAVDHLKAHPARA